MSTSRAPALHLSGHLLKPTEAHLSVIMAMSVTPFWSLSIAIQTRQFVLLTLEDTARLAKAPSEVQGNGYKTHEALLTNGIAAGAVVDGNIVAIAHTYAETDLHADIGVSTVEQWRGKGFATAAAFLVAREIQTKGKVPAWSCGEDNTASLRVAQKLGFTEVGCRTYVIPVSPE